MGWTVSALWVGPFPLTPHLVQGLSRPLPAAHIIRPRTEKSRAPSTRHAGPI